MTQTHTIHWLHHAGQRLGLVPTLGGGVAAWQLAGEQGLLDLWRPWDGRNPDLYSLASFAMLPWSNRISAGGFEHAGQNHPMAPNRAGEPYPIHGDGWLQPWTLSQPAPDTLVMSLESHHFGNNPYNYHATQTFQLLKGGLDQTVSVTHLGDSPLPYGLGLHPWFPRSPQTRLQAAVQGVWLSGADPLPTAHTADFPASWDLNQGLDVNGTLVDNAFTGWSGLSRIDWPEHQLRLEMRVPDIHDRGLDDGYCLLYRPPVGPAFCFEPVTHPIDAFHVPGQPGLRVLHAGECLTLRVQWRFHTLA
jgi:aldose 1-epimerase